MASGRIPWQAKYVLLALIWGSSFMLMKVGLSALAPVQISALRIFSGTAIVLVLARLTRTRLPRERRTWGHLAFCSILLTALPFTGFVIGETRVPSALAGIGNAFTPLSAVLFGLVLVPAERLTRSRLTAVVIGFLGVAIISEPWNAIGRPDPLGFLIILGSAACYGLGWTWNRRYLSHADIGGLAQPTTLLICGSVFMVPVLLTWWFLHRDTVALPWSLAAASHSGSAHAAYPTWVAIAAVLALGVVGTGVAYMLQYDVVRAAGAIVSTTVTYLVPVVAVLLGVIVLGEHLGLAQVIGFAVVLSAALAINRPARAPRVAESSPSAPSEAR